jgi:hypothetical protein
MESTKTAERGENDIHVLCAGFARKMGGYINSVSLCVRVALIKPPLSSNDFSLSLLLKYVVQI